MTYYLDTSAYLKLVVAEEQSTALTAWIRADDPSFLSSELLRVEALRVARRHSAEALLSARTRLDAVTLVAVTTAICERAAELDPSITRSLDAIHLATALTIGDDLAGVLTYDQRLADACAAHGVPTLAPAA